MRAKKEDGLVKIDEALTYLEVSSVESKPRDLRIVQESQVSWCRSVVLVVVVYVIIVVVALQAGQLLLLVMMDVAILGKKKREIVLYVSRSEEGRGGREIRGK
ncbi:hypothetical protein EJ05DRAFT_251 [Pseudovirgaria hyperparasitica]|uniref:Uncharacterized protein n=1 Tax=Pseudovirgaria hyperparasitica TaxID=470096 RepID=A0A6A6WJJ8_9PEZI|nr:uncharacterized protein EJ05DRAFT_251 [Pseudovirgaria hyperparasitica]KAF2762396.1 hypothetical protein EJ05DRAFT_251 [Pseudovirgaria hyperparasitica]